MRRGRVRASQTNLIYLVQSPCRYGVGWLLCVFSFVTPVDLAEHSGYTIHRVANNNLGVDAAIGLCVICQPCHRLKIVFWRLRCDCSTQGGRAR